MAQALPGNTSDILERLLAEQGMDLSGEPGYTSNDGSNLTLDQINSVLGMVNSKPLDKQVDWSSLMSSGTANYPKEQEVKEDIPVAPVQQAPINLPPVERSEAMPPKDMNFSDKEMEDALASQKQNLLSNALLSSGIETGRAIAGVNQGRPILGKEFEQLANLPVEQLEKKRAAQYSKFSKEKEMTDKIEAADPNSQHSVSYRNLAKSMLDMQGLSNISKAIDGLSAEQIDKKFPIISNIVTAKMAQDSKKELAALSAAEKAENNLIKQESKIDKLAKSLKDDIDPDKGRTGNFGAISAKVQSAERLEALASAFAGGNIPAAQIEELALGLAGMLAGAGGGRSRSQVEAIVPHSITGDANKLKSWMLNNPYGAGQQKFVKQIMHTIEREKAVSEDQLERIINRRLPAHEELKKLSPQTYNRILNRASGDKLEVPSNKTVARKQYSQSANKTKLTYSDGSEEILDGKQ